MAGPSMGKMAKAWANKDRRSHSLSEIVTLLTMKAVAWMRAVSAGKKRVNRIPLILGDSGIGKTTTLMGVFLSRLMVITGKAWQPKLWHVGTQGFEDVTGMPVIEESIAGEHTQKVARFAKSDFVPGAVWWEGGYTLGIFDELASAPTLIQNQLREMIDGQLNGEPIDPRCFYVGTSNPPDPRFTTVNAIDAAIEKRLKVYTVVPTSEELLQVWSEIMPDLIYKFLLMNRSFIDALSPREWHGVAQDVQDVIDGGGNLNEAVGEASDELYDNPSVEVALQKFVKFGTDPFYYPILGRDLIAADDGQHEQHVKLLDRWFKENQRGLVGESNNDLVRALNGIKTGTIDKKRAARNIFEFLETLAHNDCVDMVKTSMESVFNGPIVKEVSGLMRESKALKTVSEAVLRFQQLKAQVGAARAPAAV